RTRAFRPWAGTCESQCPQRRPVSPPQLKRIPLDRDERMSRIHWPIIGGALATILLAFPFAAVCAIVFRFPVPFAGYESGWSAMPHALAAVRFYGALGGFPLLAFLGALGGA